MKSQLRGLVLVSPLSPRLAAEKKALLEHRERHQRPVDRLDHHDALVLGLLFRLDVDVDQGVVDFVAQCPLNAIANLM